MMPAKNLSQDKNTREKNSSLKQLILVVASYYPIYLTVVFLIVLIFARYSYERIVEVDTSRLYRPFVIYSHPYIQDFNQYVEAPYDYRFVIPLDYKKDPLIAGNCIKLTKFNIEVNSIFINRPEYEVVENCRVLIFEAISKMRQSIIQNYQGYMKYPYSGIILKVTFGYKEEFTEKFRKGIRTLGLSHVFVVSGYNFSLLSLILRQIMSIIGKFIYTFTLMMIFSLYLAITGLNPPVISAIIMSLVTAYATVSGRVSSQFLI